MHSSEKSAPQIGDDVVAWGHKFKWTSDHYTKDEYRAWKHTYDTDGESCLNLLTSLSLVENGDLYAALRDHHHEHEQLDAFWNELTNVPDWVDWEAVARGQEVLYRYGPAMVTGLAYQSLLAGTGGTADVAEVLDKTGGFDMKNVRRRLLETTQFVLHVTDSLEAIKPGGRGFADAVRVRLLHAMVRKKIMALAASKPGYYSVEQRGVPINDADSIGTIASFSAVLIWQALPRQGIVLTAREVADYSALWRLVAFYLGTPSECFATPAKGKAIFESMLLAEFAPTPTSSRLAQNIIRGLENTPPYYASRALLETNCRWLNGNELCDAMGIGRPPRIYWLPAAVQMLLFMCVVYPVRLVPVFDRWLVANFKKTLWATVLDKRLGGLGVLSLFTMQYVPSHTKAVEATGHMVEARREVFWLQDRKVFVLMVCLFAIAAVSTRAFAVFMSVADA